MNTSPKTMSEIAQSEQDAWLNFSKGLVHFGDSSFQSVFENGFKAGFDCRDKLDNEALRLAVEVLERISAYASGEFGWSNLCAETLAEIRAVIKTKGESK